MTALDSVRVPKEFLRLKIGKTGYETIYSTAYRWFGDEFYMLKKIGTTTDDMVHVTKGTAVLSMPGLDFWNRDMVDEFLIDKYEVTNKEYKIFVDANGYRDRILWKHDFVKDNQIISWNDAMAYFTDKTDQPGPSTWVAGDYPDGEENYPVAGVSWYEAVAYAEFVDKSLPTVFHWCRVAEPWATS